jgi:hypothetical protein
MVKAQEDKNQLEGVTYLRAVKRGAELLMKRRDSVARTFGCSLTTLLFSSGSVSMR